MPDGGRTNIARHLRSFTPNRGPPAANSLLEGELSLELGGPFRIWAGVPSSVSANGMVLLTDSTRMLPDAPLDNQTYGRRTAAWNPVLPISGGTLTGFLTLNADPQFPSQAATKNYVDTRQASMPEPPTDGRVYGRSNLTWLPVLPTFGGSMTGPLTLARDAINILEPVTLQQMNARFAALPAGVTSFNGRTGPVQLWLEDVTAVLPPSIGIPLMDGIGSAGNVLEWSAADHVHPSDTSRAPIHSPTFTGTVTLAVPAVLPLEAVPLEQLNIALGSYLPLSGGVMNGGIDFGSSVVLLKTDTSRHITLHESGYGFGITANRLNYNAPINATHWFINGGTDVMRITSFGTTMGAGAFLQLDHDPTSPMEAVNLSYLTRQLNTITGSYVPLAGGTMVGALTLWDDPSYPSLPLHAVTKRYVDTGGAGGPYLPLGGGHMVGDIFLAHDPTSDMHPVTLEYLNTTVGRYLMLLGGTMQGPLILVGPSPTSGNNNEAVSKAYVDALGATLGNYLPLSGGVLTGPVHSNSPFTINWTAAPTFGFGFWDTANNYGFGMFAGNDSMLGFGSTNVGGSPTSYWVQFNSAGDIIPTGTLRLAGNSVGNVTQVLGGIEMYPGYGGFGVSPGTLNYNWIGVHQFSQGSAPIMKIEAGALNMQAPLYLWHDPPTAGTEAATKNYVDGKTGAYLPLVGGNLTGALSINPTGFPFTGYQSFDNPTLTQVWTGSAIGAVGTYIVSAGRSEPSLIGIAANGSMSSPVQPLYTQVLVKMSGRAWDSTAWSGDQAAVSIRTNEQWNATSHGTFILFQATPKGTLTANSFMLFNGSGNLLIGTNDPGTDNLTDRLQVTGSANFSGRVTLSTNPTAPLDAVNLQTLTQQITAVQGAYVAKAGDVMTGALTIQSATGANLTIHSIWASNWGGIIFNTEAATSVPAYLQVQRYGQLRWGVLLGNTTAENGGNVGTDIVIQRWADDGTTLLGNTLRMYRGTGETHFFGPVTLASDPTTALQAATMQYVDGKVGNYLPIGGGIMQGGIAFADVWGQSPSDATHHLTLHSGFGIGVSQPDRMNYIGDASAQHVFICGGDVAWIQAQGLFMASGGDVILSRVPTNTSAAVPKSYVDTFLPLAGGQMQGGIVFNNFLVNSTAGRTDLHNYIQLYSGYGFSITGGSLNIVTGQATWFSNSQTGLDYAYFNDYGLHMVGARTVNLGRDPTDRMDAVTRQYADGLIGAAGGPFLPISAGFNNALTGFLWLPLNQPTDDAMATNKRYVDFQIAAINIKLGALAQNLVFVGQIHIPTDETIFTYASGIPPPPPAPNDPLPLPPADSTPKGYYVIVVTPGSPPAGSNIPPGNYVTSDWIVNDGEEWVWLQLGLVYFVASEVAVQPTIQGTSNVQATLQWLSDNKVNLSGDTMRGQLLQPYDPTTGTSLVNRNYVTTTLANYLPLTGGVMLGGIGFVDSSGNPSYTDTSKYITLHPSGYGFSVTSYRLNYNVDSLANHVFLSGGIDILAIGQAGLTMRHGSLLLAHDPPTTGLEAATKNYVDGRTPLTTDAPNDAYSYGRHAAAWSRVGSLVQLGAGAFDLNTIPGDFIGAYQITNQTNAPNWPTDLAWAQCAYLLTGYNSVPGWNNQLLMGPAQNVNDPAIWYRNQSGGTWSPWWRMMTANGGIFTGALQLNPPLGTMPIYVQGNQPNVASGWGGALGYNFSGGGAELDFFNMYSSASTSFGWYQVTGTGTATQLAYLMPNGDLTVNGSLHTNYVWLNQTPTAPTQAATVKMVTDLQAAAAGAYVAKAGDTMSGGLTINAYTPQWGAFNFNQQLMITGVQNNTIGISDYQGANWIGITNSGGTLVFSNMPPRADTTTAPHNLLTLAPNAATFNTSKVFVQNDPTSPYEVATMQYVDNRHAAGVTSFNTRTGPVVLNNADVVGVLPGSATAPLMDGGVAAVGTSGAWAHGDHVHPSDTSKLSLSGGSMIGGLSFGQATTNTPRDMSRHISLYDNWGGFSVNGGVMNIIAGNAINIYPVDATCVVSLGSFGLLMNAGNITLAGPPTSDLHATGMKWVLDQINSKAGNYLPLSGGTLVGPLTSNSVVQFNQQVTFSSILSINSNIGGANLYGTGVGSIGWNWTNGGAEIDFVNLYTGFANPNSFSWFQYDNASTHRPLADLSRTGNLTLHGVGIAYTGITGGGNLFGFAWASNAPQVWVDGGNQGLIALQSWTNSNYLALTGGALNGDLTINSARHLYFQAVLTNTGQIWSDNNWGVVIQGLAGAAADVGIVARNGYGIRVQSDGTVNINFGASIDQSGMLWLKSDPTAGNGLQAATKQYVDTKVAGGVTRFNGRTGDVVLFLADVTSVLPPYAGSPLMDGTTTPGISNTFARGDHVHPNDTSKFNVAGGDINGSVWIHSNNLTVGDASHSFARVTVWSPPTTSPGYSWATNQNRWVLALDQGTETTNNSDGGGNLQLYRYHDDGSFAGAVMGFNRNDGSANFTGPVYLAGNATTNLGAVPLQQLNSTVGNYLPLAGGNMNSGAIINMQGVGQIQFGGSALTIHNTGQDAASITAANLAIGTWNGLGVTCTIGQVSPFVPPGLYGVVVDARWGHLWVHGLLGASDSRPNAVSNIQTLKIYRASSGDQVLQLDANTTTPALISSTPVAGGSGYAVNDRLYDAQGNFYTVTAITGSAVSTIQLDSCRANMAAPPSNPVTLTAATGSGTGCTVNLTWGVPPRLLIQHISGIVSLYGTQGLQLNAGGAGIALYAYAAFSGHAQFQAGIDFGNQVSPSQNPQDTSNHIALWGTGANSYGFCVTGSTLNYNAVGTSVKHDFYSDTRLLFRIQDGSAVTSYVPFIANSNLTVAGTLQTFGQAYFYGVNPQVNIDGPAATWRTLQFSTSGVYRWNVQATVDAESTGDAGSNFAITRFHDNGQPIDAPLTINRATGNATFNSNLIVNGALYQTGHATFVTGISFNNSVQSSPTDLSHGIDMYGGGYGFSITGGTLNCVAGGTFAIYPAGAWIASFNNQGLQFTSGTTATLGRDATAPMEAVTLQQVGNTAGSVGTNYTTPGTYSYPDPGKGVMIGVLIYGGGGGGGGGSAGFSTGVVDHSGGAGGGGGAAVYKVFRRADLTFPISVVVGAGATGGAGGIYGGPVIATAGNTGGATTFGGYLAAYGGGGGCYGSTGTPGTNGMIAGGGGGGGRMGAGSVGGTGGATPTGIGGAPNTQYSSSLDTIGPGGANNRFNAEWGGGGGGDGAGGNNVYAGSAGGSSINGGAAGGGGGSTDTNNNTLAGRAGGAANSFTLGGGGTAGPAGGQAGGAGAAGNTTRGGGGGGGGGAGNPSSNLQAGGNGGNGGACGGGGGGGGGTSQNSPTGVGGGVGGKGGDGAAFITVW